MNGTGWISFQLREEWVRRRSRDRSWQDRVWEWEKRGRKDIPPARNGAAFPTAFGTCYCHHYKAISAPPFVDVSRAVETALYLPLPRTRDVPRLLPVLGQKSPRSTRKKGRDKWLAKRTSFSFLRLFRIVRPGWNGTSRTLTRRWSSSRMRGTRFHAISRSGDSFLIFQSRRYLIIRFWSLSSGILTGFSLWIEIIESF